MRSMILGTDWWTDCDDAVALRLLTGFIKQQKIRLLGIAINACMEHSVASLKAFLEADGVFDVPVGIDRTATDFGGKPPYQKRLAQLRPSLSNDDACDAVRLYRTLLAKATEPVEILEIGYPQVLAALLKSKGDDLSPKTGRELFAEKVSKAWIMAGKWDADGERENNFCRNPRSRMAGRELCELCPVPITFLGWEVGHSVITGDKLDRNDHLYEVLCDHGSPNGRSSWDPMLVLMALLGSEEEAGYTTVCGYASVDPEDGANHFKKDPNGPHRYVVKQYPDTFYSNQINALLSESV